MWCALSRQSTSHQTHTTKHHKFTLKLNPPSLQNKTTNVVIQQHSRKLPMMDILISETCWAHKKWNKIASDIKLVFYFSIITMMHGPINIILLIHVQASGRRNCLHGSSFQYGLYQWRTVVLKTSIFSPLYSPLEILSVLKFSPDTPIYWIIFKIIHTHGCLKCSRQKSSAILLLFFCIVNFTVDRSLIAIFNCNSFINLKFGRPRIVINSYNKTN